VRIAAVGEQTAVAGYGLAGAVVVIAEDAAQAVAAWRALPSDITVAIVTERVAHALQASAAADEGPMMVVIPR
jgi:vacuolar-type H+-ATPase subunit F/Vma7